MIGCIIQARMGSTRLPGKVMMKIDEENPILYYVLNQLKYAKQLEKIVVATTELSEDDIIVEYLKKLDIDFFRGNSKDVLDRYYQCAKKYSFEIIVRVTADNPLIDPEIVDMIIKDFKSNFYDYVSNALSRTFPYGTEVEVFSFKALQNAWKNAKKPSEREHVTPYIQNPKNLFKINNVSYSDNISHLRWTVDRESDLELVRLIVSKIHNRPILLKDILELFSKEPQLIKINESVIPNEGYMKSLKEDDTIL